MPKLSPRVVASRARARSTTVRVGHDTPPKARSESLPTPFGRCRHISDSSRVRRTNRRSQPILFLRLPCGARFACLHLPSPRRPFRPSDLGCTMACGMRRDALPEHARNAACSTRRLARRARRASAQEQRDSRMRVYILQAHAIYLEGRNEDTLKVCKG